MIDYGLWLPFDEITKSNYPLESFIDSYFEALIIVFKKYNVFEDDIRKLKKECKNEILNNTEYLLEEDI